MANCTFASATRFREIDSPRTQPHHPRSESENYPKDTRTCHSNRRSWPGAPFSRLPPSGTLKACDGAPVTTDIECRGRPAHIEWTSRLVVCRLVFRQRDELITIAWDRRKLPFPPHLFGQFDALQSTGHEVPVHMALTNRRTTDQDDTGPF